MAADTLVRERKVCIKTGETVSNHYFYTIKILIREDGVYGCSGFVSLIKYYFAKLDGKKSNVKLENNATMTAIQYSNGFIYKIIGRVKIKGFWPFRRKYVEFRRMFLTDKANNTYHTCGSGSDFAFGVLVYDKNSSALDALDVACREDDYSSYPIIAYDCINKQWIKEYEGPEQAVPLLKIKKCQ